MVVTKCLYTVELVDGSEFETTDVADTIPIIKDVLRIKAEIRWMNNGNKYSEITYIYDTENVYC